MTDKTTLVGGFPVPQLREMLKATDDKVLAGFLHSYALAFGADQFISAMVRPEERIGFLLGIAKTYPEDWAKAIAILAKEAK
jgi:hypothetical protein